MRLGLTGRIVVGVLLLGAFFLTQVVITYDAFRTIHRATGEAQRAEQSITGALRVEKLVLDLQTGSRGYAITGQRRFLAPWETARRLLQRDEQLGTLGSPAFERVLHRDVGRALQISGSVVRLTSVSPPRARAFVATGRGLELYTRLQREIDVFVAARQALLAHDRSVVSRAESSGLRIGAVGIAVRVLVVLGLVLYLLRAIIVPLRRVAAGTHAVAAGELGVQVPDRGPGEVGELARSFNDMSSSLADGRRILDDQNERLERFASVLRTVLDSTVDGILLSDADGEIRLVNRPMVQLAGELGLGGSGPVLDRLLAVADHVSEPDRFREAMERLRADPAEASFDEFEHAASGRVLQGFTSPVLDDRGTLIGRVWTLRDVTPQRDLDRLKDEFIATVSHELRTPLTSMMGFLEMLREGEAGELTAEQERFLAIVYRSSERLQRLVGDLLFVSRLDANGLELSLAPVGVDAIARDEVESHAALARARALELVAQLDDLPPLRGDSERLSQLVGNLISNAVKFTPAGGRVLVRTFRDGSQAVIEVEDTGIGIPAAELPRVFERFFRSSTATEQAIPGTGLGLVISKAIAEAHGGTITVRSEPGHGTCFRVELPLAASPVPVP